MELKGELQAAELEGNAPEAKATSSAQVTLLDVGVIAQAGAGTGESDAGSLPR